jgi:hypothetical protein
MTLRERRIERVEIGLRIAEEHLKQVKAGQSVHQGALLCEIVKKLQTHVGDLQKVLIREWGAESRKMLIRKWKAESRKAARK